MKKIDKFKEKINQKFTVISLCRPMVNCGEIGLKKNTRQANQNSYTFEIQIEHRN